MYIFLYIAEICPEQVSSRWQKSRVVMQMAEVRLFMHSDNVNSRGCWLVGEGFLRINDTDIFTGWYHTQIERET